MTYLMKVYLMKVCLVSLLGYHTLTLILCLVTWVSSPILNNTISGPNVEARSLVKNPTSLISDGANFLKSSNINLESYQNLPSSPLSISSSNMSALTKDGAQQVASRRGRQNHDISSLFTGKELDYLSQMSKKPKLDSQTVSALDQYFIQQPLQRQEPLLYQDYNQQMKTLLQQNNLQKLKQNQRLMQVISQYVGVPTQQQMHYLQQMAKRSVPGIIPFHSGICSRRIMQFIYHLQQRPSDNSITYWRKFVAEYYACCGKKRWCLSLYNDVGERALGVFSQLAMEAWNCDMCGSKSGKGFEANFELLPRLYRTYFESGVLDELLFLDLPHEYVLPSGLIVLQYEKAVQQTIYEKFRVVREGQLRITFRNDLKILAWEFCARCHDEVLPRSLVSPQVNELVQAAEKCQGKGGSSSVAVRNLQSTCKMFVAAEGQLMRNLDSLLVNDLGFPKMYIRCLQIAEVMNSMKDLMTFSIENNVGPIESLAKYSRQETAGNTNTKQAVNEETICQEKTQSCTSNSEKQKVYGSVNYPNANADCTPNLDPKSSSLNLTQRSPVISCTSSSTFSEFDDKVQEQIIAKILQQMESNTREQAHISKSVKVKEEVIEDSNGDPVGTRNIGAAVWRSVQQNGSKMRENANSAIGNICVKQEPDVEDFYKDLYLPEAIKDVERGFFCIGKGKH